MIPKARIKIESIIMFPIIFRRTCIISKKVLPQVFKFQNNAFLRVFQINKLAFAVNNNRRHLLSCF